MTATRESGSRPGDSRREKFEVILRLALEVYPQLCAIARGYLRKERDNEIVMALVHDALLLIDVDDSPRTSEDLIGIAAFLMRRVLVDRARRDQSWQRYASSHATDGAPGASPPDPALDTEALSSALNELACKHPRAARVFELRFVHDCSVEETARRLGCCPRTVNSDSKVAREWLARYLGPAD